MVHVPDSEIHTYHQAKPPENPFLNAIEGYYTCAILDALHNAGLLIHLKSPCTALKLAKISNTDVHMLAPLLTYLCGSGECLSYDPSNKTYCIHPSYVNDPMSAHLLDQYIGAYGPCLAALDHLLREPSSGGSFVDHNRHAAAFIKASGAPQDLIDLILRLKPGTVLDLGCGSAGLLRYLVETDLDMHGIGIDSNPMMLELAQNKINNNTEDRLQFYTCEVLNIEEIMSANTRDDVDLIVAQSLANEFFADKTIDDFLIGLSSAFPNRLLILADYYGCLSEDAPLFASDQRRGALHDVAQLLSGQGIPPNSLEDWQNIYARTGCTLLKASSIVSGGLHRFIHIVKI